MDAKHWNTNWKISKQIGREAVEYVDQEEALEAQKEFGGDVQQIG